MKLGKRQILFLRELDENKGVFTIKQFNEFEPNINHQVRHMVALTKRGMITVNLKTDKGIFFADKDTESIQITKKGRDAIFKG